jgi:hypothetical protein
MADLKTLLMLEGVAVRKLETSGQAWDYSNVLKLICAELDGSMTEGAVEAALAAHYDALNGDGTGDEIDDA